MRKTRRARGQEGERRAAKHLTRQESRRGFAAASAGAAARRAPWGCLWEPVHSAASVAWPRMVFVACLGHLQGVKVLSVTHACMFPWQRPFHQVLHLQLRFRPGA